MKKTTILLIFSILFFNIVHAQSYHYKFLKARNAELSFNIGKNNFSSEIKGTLYDVNLNGSGTFLDFKAGFSNSNRKLYYHINYYASRNSNLRIKKIDSNVDIREFKYLSITSSFVGLGVTYYVTPDRYYASTTLSCGKIFLENTFKNSNYDFKHNYGFGFQIMAGKTFKIDDVISFNIGLSYNRYYAKNEKFYLSSIFGNTLIGLQIGIIFS